MSSSSGSVAGEGTLSQINFTGGFPTHKDLAPSIIFLVLYILTIPVMAWRIASPVHRTILLFRPTLFLGCRIAMLAVRIDMAKTETYSLGLLIAELVLVSVGYLFLIEPMIAMWHRHVGVDVPKSRQPLWVRYGYYFLIVLLLAAIAITAASGGIVSEAFNSPSKLKTVKDMREAGYILSLIVTFILLAAEVLTSFHFDLPLIRSLYVITPTVLLLIVAVYRVAQTFEMNPSDAARSLAAFYILQITFEFFAYLFTIAISIPQWFPKSENDNKTGAQVAAQMENPNRSKV